MKGDKLGQAAGWAAGLRLARPARLEVAKPITLVIPYYENPGWLRSQIGRWAWWPAAVKAAIVVHLVDDGSPAAPARAVLEAAALEGLALPRIRGYRIGVDIRWNWLAARNLGAHEAAPGWILLTDIDHVIPEQTLEAAVFGALDPAVVYGFLRRDGAGRELAPHPNSWLITRDRYWRIGGYDETLSGHYGTDGDWRRRVAQSGRLEILAESLIRREHEGDSSTRAYLRKQPEDSGVRAIVAARGPEWRPRALSFPWTFEIEIGGQS